MNKRDREQLRASISRDLIQGQGQNSATRNLLKQYAPLEGIVTPPGSRNSAHSDPPQPVEKSMAPAATAARDDDPAWHGATVAQHATPVPGATLAQYAMVKGELRVPNTINFSLFPTLDPFAKAVYYQLFLLSHGFRRDTCLVGLAKLAKSVLMSQRKVQNTITYLEKRGLIKRLESCLGGQLRGNLYQVLVPAACVAPDATVAQGATLARNAAVAPQTTVESDATLAHGANNKEKLDDDLEKIKSSSKAESAIAAANGEPKNHTTAAAPPEKQPTACGDRARVRAAYEKATGNRWSKSDTEAYQASRVYEIPVSKIISVLETVPGRTPAKINSFNYFVKEITSEPDPRNRAWRKKKLQNIVGRIRDNSIGAGGHSAVDFLEDVKCACAHENVLFDDDLYNELVG